MYHTYINGVVDVDSSGWGRADTIEIEEACGVNLMDKGGHVRPVRAD